MLNEERRYNCTIYPDGTKICRPKPEERPPPTEPSSEGDVEHEPEHVGRLKRVIMEFEEEEEKEGEEDER